MIIRRTEWPNGLRRRFESRALTTFLSEISRLLPRKRSPNSAWQKPTGATSNFCLKLNTCVLTKLTVPSTIVEKKTPPDDRPSCSELFKKKKKYYITEQPTYYETS